MRAPNADGVRESLARNLRLVSGLLRQAHDLSVHGGVNADAGSGLSRSSPLPTDRSHRGLPAVRLTFGRVLHAVQVSDARPSYGHIGHSPIRLTR